MNKEKERENKKGGQIQLGKVCRKLDCCGLGGPVEQFSPERKGIIDDGNQMQVCVCEVLVQKSEAMMQCGVRVQARVLK